MLFATELNKTHLLKNTLWDIWKHRFDTYKEYLVDEDRHTLSLSINGGDEETHNTLRWALNN